MSFDEQLKQAFDTLTDRLRDHIAREVAGISEELLKQAQAERELAATKAAADARADAERTADARVSDAEDAALARVRDAEKAVAARVSEAEKAGAARLTASEQAAAARLADTVSAAESAVEARIGDAFDTRVARAVEDAVAAARDQRRAADLAAGERLLDAFRAIDRARSLSEILDALVGSARREASRVGILLVRGEMLKAWRLIGFGFGFDAAHETELAVDASGVIGDALRSGTAASSDVSGPLAGAPFELPEGRQRVAVPIPMSGQVVAVLYADQGAQDDPERVTATAWAAMLDVMARHAARCLEALTAFKAARVLTDHPDVAAAAAAGASGAEGPADTDDHESARRYARLLVTEIKLYNEPAVEAGRRDRDLASRLATEIGRARVLYDQRVPAHVRQHTDHFHAELVRTLADGDATLLGQST